MSEHIYYLRLLRTRVYASPTETKSSIDVVRRLKETIHTLCSWYVKGKNKSARERTKLSALVSFAWLHDKLY